MILTFSKQFDTLGWCLKPPLISCVRLNIHGKHILFNYLLFILLYNEINIRPSPFFKMLDSPLSSHSGEEALVDPWEDVQGSWCWLNAGPASSIVARVWGCSRPASYLSLCPSVFSDLNGSHGNWFRTWKFDFRMASGNQTFKFWTSEREWSKK